jgi:hypothetical protein
VTWVTRAFEPVTFHYHNSVPLSLSAKILQQARPNKRGVSHLVHFTCFEYSGGFLISSARQHLGVFLGAFFFSRFYGARGSRLGYRADPEAAAPRSGPAGEPPTS